MLIFAIDDEKIILEDERRILEKAAEGAEILTFTRGKAALDAVLEGKKPDAVFCGIEMPGLSGLEFAVKLKQLSPETRIIFATGFEKYAVEAFRLKVHGYLLKPLTVEAVKEELEQLELVPKKTTPAEDKLVVHCFGHFDVYWKGEPVFFARKQSKELLAYLVDRQGAACSAGEIAIALWEKESCGKVEHNRIRVLINDLKKTLQSIGMEQVLIREHRELAIRKDLIDCDYYRMLEGDMDAVNSYRGEYMMEYSWAEITNADLRFRRQ